jgi:hypothetical protein
MSVHDTALAGVPLTWNRPLVLSSTTSSALASSRSAALSVACAASRTDASIIDEPAICAEREPPVTLDHGTMSVSPWMNVILSIGMPSSSLMSMPHVV